MAPNRIPEFPYQLAEYLEQSRRTWMTSSVYLGGTSGSGGGAGGPPGGFVGQLVQSRIAYDSSELSLATTSSAPSLLDNLNHIRYLITTGSFGSGGGGVTGSGVAGRVAYWTSGSGLGSDSAFTWDSVNDKLGIGSLVQTSGSMSLAGNRFTLDSSIELDPTGAVTGQTLAYNGTKWVATTGSGGGFFYSGVSGSGVAGRVALWTSGSILGSNAGFSYDTSTGRLTSGSVGVEFYGAVSGQVLSFNGTKWIPSSGSAIPWFIVTSYGAVGDGTTDDTAAITSAVSALNSAGGGVLYFPLGVYKTSGGFTLSENCIVMGDGDYWATSKITCTSATAVLFQVNADVVNFRDIYLINTHATPTAGNAINGDATVNGQHINLQRVTVDGFYDDVVYLSGSNWVIDSCWIGNARRYGLFVSNLFLGDQGDWGVINSVFTCAANSPTSAVRIISSGGGRFIGNKINSTSTGWDNGIDLLVSDPTSILIIEGNSFENVRSNAILLQNAAGSDYAHIIINGNQFGMYNNGTDPVIVLNAVALGDITNIVISDNVFFTPTPTTDMITATNIDNLRIVDNITDGYTNVLSQSGCTNVFLDSSGGDVATDVIWNAKGDLAVGTGSDTAIRLGVGSNGTVLTADSTQTSGLRWATSGSSTSGSSGTPFTSDYLQSSYTTAPISLGTSTDGSFVDADATNAIITFTPALAGKYLVTFIFSSYVKAAELDMFIRLTDGTTTSTPQEIYAHNAVTADRETPVTLSFVYDWTAASHSVKLQKRIVTATTVTGNSVAAGSGNGEGLYMSAIRIGV